MTLGEQIRKNREEAGFSQEELAEQVGVSRQAVSKWESDISVPTGANRRTVSQILKIELPQEEVVSGRNRFLRLGGWILSAVLLCAFLCLLILQKNGPAVEAPALQSVRFYDAEQEEILPEALWYNTASAESILLQWSGGVPETVKMFFTPSGTETVEETELLAVRSVQDGGTAMLLSAKPLHRESLMGHLSFELDFGRGNIIMSDTYEVIFDPMM